MKPTIREQKTFDYCTCPSVPTYEAGYLVGGNGDWRSERPVVTPEACTGCQQCYLYCPDGAISPLDAHERRSKIQIDYDFCKGCGICVRVCHFDALHMEAEPRD